MNYHLIKTDDMLNGSGLRVVLYLSGCSHACHGCHNPETWDCNSGKEFDENAINELLAYMKHDYISGLTLSGGDPLNENNLDGVLSLCQRVRELYSDTKNIWLYTGYKWEELFTEWVTGKDQSRRRKIIELCDVLVDGRFEQDKADVSYPWAGSTNQRVIDIKKSLEENKVALWLG